MARYRKKPVVIEAEQWWPEKDIPGVETDVVWPTPSGHPEIRAWITTPEGRLMVSPGDWIITGVKCEKYPCKDDIFRQTYEPVEE